MHQLLRGLSVVLTLLPALLSAAASTEPLPANQDQALLLRYYEDRTVEDIAEALGRSPTAVRRLLGRAHLHLSEALSHAGGGR